MIYTDYHSSLLWITAVFILSLDFIIYLGSTKTSSRIFAFFSMLIAMWSISYGIFISTESDYVALILIKLNHVIGIVTALGFTWFSISYPNDSKLNNRLALVLWCIGIIYSSLIIFSDLIIKFMFEIDRPDHWGWEPGILYFTYSILFLILWLHILFNINSKCARSQDKHEKINCKFMFWGLLLGIIPPFVLNIILPTFKIYGISWTGPIASAIWVFVIGYSIMRYRQMNVLIVITEMLAVAMTIMFFINIFVRADLGVAENILTFSVFLLVATYLIRTVLSEEKIKQQLHVLNETLEDKVREQTQDIRNALDGERLAKRELEKLNETKNQFIMITQHSIRTPLQNLKRDLGHDISKLSLRNIERLTAITDDFLSISSIESNKQILELKPHSLLPIINKVLEDFEIDINRMQLKISYDRNEQKWPKINIDHNKIYELFTIVIENAIKYNNEGGEISISSDGNEKKQTIVVSDTGLGLSQDDLKKINSNLFYRSESAKKNNPHGMGVGLSVAKMIAKAHHGAISIESDGHNMGSKITIELRNDYLQDIIDN